MTLPGENTLTLTNAALMRLVQERINNDLSTSGAVLRVTAIKYASYGGSAEFTISTDPLPASDTITNQESK